MQAGTLAPGIQEWRVHVEVNGVTRAAESVSIDADIASDLPDEVAGVSGVSARTGTIQWAPQSAVIERPATPWNRTGAWPPQPGDRVDIWAGDADTSWKVFTGRIDTTEGDTESLSSRIIDATDQLDRPVSLDPVAHTMPGYYDETTDYGFSPVQTFVQPWHAAYRAMRAAGFGVAAPTQVGGSRILDVDFQGSIWPALGHIRHSTGAVDAALDWGEGFTYLSAGSVAYGPRAVTISGGVRAWVRVAALPGGVTGTLLLVHDSGRMLRARASLDASLTTLTVTCELWDGDPSGSGTLLGSGQVTAPAIIEDGSAWAEVWMPSGGDAIRVVTAQTGATVGTPNGGISQVLSLGATTPSGGQLTQVSVGGQVVAVRAGVISYTDWAAMSSQTSPGRVRAWGRGLVNSQYVSRTQVKRNARDLLAEIGSATLTAMWIDEMGVMQWAPTNVMYLGSPVRTFTTRDDIFELGWVESLQATRRKVYGKFKNAALNVSTGGYTVTLYRPDNVDSITGPLEEFIETPSDREWFGVDTTMWRASAVQDRYNAGKGSFYSAVKEFGQDNYTWVGSEYSATLERITPVTWKLTHANTAGKIELMTHPDSTSLRRSRRGQPAPIIRGLGHISLVEDAVTGDATGPSWAPDMEVDFGAWAIKGHAQQVVDWLSHNLATPLVTLTDVEVEYDPRIQLGDVVRIDSTMLLGMAVNAVVVGKRETHGNGAHMSLTVRVISTITRHTTWGEFEAAYTGKAYAALESAWAGANYGGLENSPLGRI